jgi:23S rRNA pseudouridine1911/1915/1917 synthase
MLVINKPAGLVTHPGSGIHDQTLVNGLLFKIGSSLSGINGVMRPGIVHRLDKDTSGLMVVAKNDLAHKNLAQQIETRELKRNYLALCYGTPNPSDGQINQNIDRCKNNRLKMRTVKRGGKTAITNYKTQKSYFDGLISLVECKLDTGRTHQIRVHMDAIGHPLIGDQLYKSKRHFLGSLNQELENILNNFPRQFLHSHKIAFFHPKSNQEMQFTINLPQDLENLLKNISK